MRITVEDMLVDLRRRRRVWISQRRRVDLRGEATRALVLAAWFRADQLAAGVTRLATSRPALAESIGIIGRTLWEGAVRVQYAAQSPSTRLYQMRNHALREEAKVLKGEWAQGAEDKIDQRYFEFQREALAEPKDQRLPPLLQMARDLGAVAQYDAVYRMESAGVHWTLTAVADHARHRGGERFIVAGRGRHRLPQVMALATSSYSVIVAHCSELAGLPSKPFDEVHTRFSEALRQARASLPVTEPPPRNDPEARGIEPGPQGPDTEG